mgnify:CR=1 FL=1
MLRLVRNKGNSEFSFSVIKRVISLTENKKTSYPMWFQFLFELEYLRFEDE